MTMKGYSTFPGYSEVDPTIRYSLMSNPENFFKKVCLTPHPCSIVNSADRTEINWEVRPSTEGIKKGVSDVVKIYKHLYLSNWLWDVFSVTSLLLFIPPTSVALFHCSDGIVLFAHHSYRCNYPEIYRDVKKKWTLILILAPMSSRFSTALPLTCCSLPLIPCSFRPSDCLRSFSSRQQTMSKRIIPSISLNKQIHHSWCVFWCYGEIIFMMFFMYNGISAFIWNDFNRTFFPTVKTKVFKELSYIPK